MSSDKGSKLLKLTTITMFINNFEVSDSNSPKKESEETAAVGSTPSVDKEDSSLEKIRQYLSEKLNLNETSQPEDAKILDTLDLDGVVKCWKNGGFKKIVTMVGAGISTCE